MFRRKDAEYLNSASMVKSGFIYKIIDDASPFSHERVREFVNERNNRVIKYIHSQNDSSLWFWALKCGCRYGNDKIIQCSLENHDGIDIGYGFCDACSGGNLDLVGRIVCQSVNIDWNNGLANAIRGHHTDIVHFIFKKARKPLNYNYALRVAAYHGPVSIVQALISRGANDLDGALYKAALKNQHEIGILLIRKGARIPLKNNNVQDQVKRARTIVFVKKILIAALR